MKKKSAAPAVAEPESGDDAPRRARAATRNDKIIGANIRRLRLARNMTLSAAAERLRLSHQQLQKYETGANRLSAGMIPEVAALFHVPIIALFEGIVPDGDAPRGRDRSRIADLKGECEYLVNSAQSAEQLSQIAKVIRAML